MNPFARLNAQHGRALRIKNYRKVRATLEAMTETDLDDIGVKRFQLGSIARRAALG